MLRRINGNAPAEAPEERGKLSCRRSCMMQEGGRDAIVIADVFYGEMRDAGSKSSIWLASRRLQVQFTLTQLAPAQGPFRQGLCN